MEEREEKLRQAARRWAAAKAEEGKLEQQMSDLNTKLAEHRRDREAAAAQLNDFVGRNTPRQLVKLDGMNMAVLVQHREVRSEGEHGVARNASDVSLEVLW